MDIKFKAYIKSLGWLVDVERINFDCKTVEVDLSAGQGDTSEYDFDEVELLQYIGLKDKNDVEIYKGDILKDDKGKIYEIVWGHDLLWLAKTNEPHCNCYSPEVAKRSEKIGNIYENKDLLKGEQ